MPRRGLVSPAPSPGMQPKKPGGGYPFALLLALGLLPEGILLAEV